MAVRSDSKTPLKGRALEHNGHPTWKAIIVVAISCMGIAGGAGTWAWSLHISRPHEDAATEADLESVKTDIGRDIQRLETRQIRIEDKIDDIHTRVLRGSP